LKKIRQLEIKTYQEYTKTTAGKEGFWNKREEILCWALGAIGEAGDLAGCLKKTLFHENDQIAGIRENVGDVMWYLAMICNFFGWDLRKILDENKTKLDKRMRPGYGATRSKGRTDWMEKE